MEGGRFIASTKQRDAARQPHLSNNVVERRKVIVNHGVLVIFTRQLIDRVFDFVEAVGLWHLVEHVQQLLFDAVASKD